MIYSSIIPRDNRVPQFVLLRHKRNLSYGEPTDDNNLVYMGGHKDYRLTGPSKGDIERVATLYPKDPQSISHKTSQVTDKTEKHRASRRALRKRRSPEPGHNEKRSYTIPSIEEDTRLDNVRTWPPDKKGEGSKMYFCFHGQDALSQLYPIFKEALLKWDSAIRESSLSIVPSPACPKEEECLCTLGSRLALFITLGSPDAPQTSSTFGFRDPTGAPPQGDFRRYNQLIFTPTKNHGYNVVTMAHEIGKLSFAFRLEHPDGDANADANAGQDTRLASFMSTSDLMHRNMSRSTAKLCLLTNGWPSHLRHVACLTLGCLLQCRWKRR